MKFFNFNFRKKTNQSIAFLSAHIGKLQDKIKELESEDGRLERVIEQILCEHPIEAREVQIVETGSSMRNEESCGRCGKCIGWSVSPERIIEIKEEQLELLKYDKEVADIKKEKEELKK